MFLRTEQLTEFNLKLQFDQQGKLNFNYSDKG